MNTIKTKLKNPYRYIWWTIVFFLFAILMFTWRQWSQLDLHYPIDASQWGQFGDFVSGTLGVVFALISVVFIVLTFRGQQESAYEQRFSDLFFELLKILGEQEQELQYSTELTKEGSVYSFTSNNKDFFTKIHKLLNDNYVPATLMVENRTKASSLYLKTCVSYKDKLSLVYKTMYRILDIVDNSNLSSKSINDYVKVFRAQFTDGELLCVRYHVLLGDYRNFAYLLIKYNIMKHLPIFELLEFSYWSKYEGITEEERYSIGKFFIELSKMIHKRQNYTFQRCGGALMIYVYCASKKLTINITKVNDPLDREDALSGIYKYKIEDLEHLLEYFIREIVVYSNYSTFNKYGDLNFENKVSEDKKSITVSVESKCKSGLHLNFLETCLSKDSMPKLW